MAGEHLIAQGRRKIAFLGQADEHYPEFADRYRGLRDAMDQAGLGFDERLQLDALTTEEEGYRAARALLAREAPFDGLFAGSDLIAIGALRALAEAGLAVPDDVAVVGFDDISTASVTTPPLTTLMQDTRNAGALLVDTLIAQIENTPHARKDLARPPDRPGKHLRGRLGPWVRSLQFHHIRMQLVARPPGVPAVQPEWRQKFAKVKGRA